MGELRAGKQVGNMICIVENNEIYECYMGNHDEGVVVYLKDAISSNESDGNGGWSFLTFSF